MFYLTVTHCTCGGAIVLPSQQSFSLYSIPAKRCNRFQWWYTAKSLVSWLFKSFTWSMWYCSLASSRFKAASRASLFFSNSFVVIVVQCIKCNNEIRCKTFIYLLFFHYVLKKPNRYSIQCILRQRPGYRSVYLVLTNPQSGWWYITRIAYVIGSVEYSYWNSLPRSLDVHSSWWLFV